MKTETERAEREQESVDAASEGDCVVCGEPGRAQDARYEVNNVGPACSLTCADAARKDS